MMWKGWISRLPCLGFETQIRRTLTLLQPDLLTDAHTANISSRIEVSDKTVAKDQSKEH